MDHHALGMAPSEVSPFCLSLPLRRHVHHLACEATEDKNRLRCDGVDNVADVLVVVQEIDELGNLDVVDGDLGLGLGDNDQVLLLGPLQF
jgi:hypothetical protein